MRSKIKIIEGRKGREGTKGTGLRGAVWLFLLGWILVWAAAPAKAQIGTYVAPRPVVLFSQWVTNGESLANQFVLTNLLNYSGFHRVGFMVTEAATNGATLGTNATTLTVDQSPGAGNGYTNAPLGTNIVFTSNAPWGWVVAAPSPNAASETLFTNLDWTMADNVAWLRGTKLTVLSTNGFYLQIDGIITP